MRILIVDDNVRKIDRIREVLREAVGSEVALVDAVRSTSEAAETLESTHYDLLILDLNLPIRPGNQPDDQAGIRFLRQILRGGPRFRRPVHMLGLTEYDELIGSFSTEFSL